MLVPMNLGMPHFCFSSLISGTTNVMGPSLFFLPQPWINQFSKEPNPCRIFVFRKQDQSASCAHCPWDAIVSILSERT